MGVQLRCGYPHGQHRRSRRRRLPASAPRLHPVQRQAADLHEGPTTAPRASIRGPRPPAGDRESRRTLPAPGRLGCRCGELAARRTIRLPGVPGIRAGGCGGDSAVCRDEGGGGRSGAGIRRAAGGSPLVHGGEGRTRGRGSRGRRSRRNRRLPDRQAHAGEGSRDRGDGCDGVLRRQTLEERRSAIRKASAPGSETQEG